ncbi:MAG: Maf family protein [bacterium]
MIYKSLTELAGRVSLILGSSSPRRLELLTEMGVAFRQICPEVDEQQLEGEPAFDFALRLAESKALSISTTLGRGDIVIGCDTIVVLGDKVLGKPLNPDHALETLSKLSGRQHQVCSAVAFSRGERVLASGYDVTTVRFNEVSSARLRQYIATGEPLDKAGAYGIQGMGAFLVDTIEGNLDTVIGLPRRLLDRFAAQVLTEL